MSYCGMQLLRWEAEICDKLWLCHLGRIWTSGSVSTLFKEKPSCNIPNEQPKFITLYFPITAVNTVDFFNQINMLYGTITEFCTEEKCPIMSASAKYEYKWADGQQVLAL